MRRRRRLRQVSLFPPKGLRSVYEATNEGRLVRRAGGYDGHILHVIESEFFGQNSRIVSTQSQSTAASARPCPLCGATDRHVLTKREPWEIVECAACGM